jgi:two-component system, chemotaxis family, protein-glutamate methylesterase/glutaminase
MRLGSAPTIEKYGRAEQSLARVLVVDDSITARAVLRQILDQDPCVEIVGQASRAEQALDLLKTLKVDLILLDLEMPGIGGLAALPQLIEASGGANILIVSSLAKEGAEQTLKALSLGAADTIAKPTSGLMNGQFRAELSEKVRSLGIRRKRASVAVKVPRAFPVCDVRPSLARPPILAIGGSTGGIHAMCKFLKLLPVSCNVPIVVTQHLPADFMEVFARQLTDASGRVAQVATRGLELLPGHIVIAPGNAHLLVKFHGNRYFADLKSGRSESGCLPSVDVMLTSLAESCGESATAVILSGMGKDGLIGARHLTAKSGTILAQDEDSSAVWGMPRAVIEAGLTNIMLDPPNLAAHVSAHFGQCK